VKQKLSGGIFQNGNRPGLTTGAGTLQLAKLRDLAFDNSLQSHIIATALKGQVIVVNRAACKLPGYSEKELLTKNLRNIFETKESNFKNMLKRRMTGGASIAFVTGIKKNGIASLN
jgi:PAS domain S-box-containing protein